jgi:hypothetical protein
LDTKDKRVNAFRNALPVCPTDPENHSTRPGTFFE